MSRFGRKNVVPPKRTEQTTFEKFEKTKAEVVTETRHEELKARLLLLGEEAFTILNTFAHDDDIREHDAKLYNLELIEILKKKNDKVQYYKVFEGEVFRRILKAASACMGVKFSNCGAKANVAMSGEGSIKNGYWIVEADKVDNMVKPISSEQVCDLQLFCSATAVKVKRIRREGPDGTEEVNVPRLIPKNFVQDAQMPREIKYIFRDSLLVIPEGKDFDLDTIASSPFIWTHIFNLVKDTKIPVIGASMEIVYFLYVRKSFDYNRGPLLLDDILYHKYPLMMKELGEHAAKYAVYVGGHFLNKFHYLNEGVRYLKNRRIGGQLPVKWCAYNTFKDVTWERNGAFAEGISLGTKVEAVRSMAQFDGAWYDPISSSAPSLRKATALIVPYDQGGQGLAFINDWVLQQGKAARFTWWTTYGPSPCLWIEKTDKGCAFIPVSVDVLWKSLPIVNFYNYAASLNRNMALAEVQGDVEKALGVYAEYDQAGVPYRPISSLLCRSASKTKTYNQTTWVDGVERQRSYTVPTYTTVHFPDSYLPGRHMISTASSFVEEVRDSFAQFAQFKETHADIKGMTKKGGRRKTAPKEEKVDVFDQEGCPAEPGQPSSKRQKMEDEDDADDMPDYDGDTAPVSSDDDEEEDMFSHPNSCDCDTCSAAQCADE